MFYLDVRSKVDLAKVLIFVPGLIFLTMNWGREIFFVYMWGSNPELLLVICTISLTLLSNLYFNKSSLWLVVALLVLASEFLALINCSRAILAILLDKVQYYHEPAFPSFAFVALCVLFLSALRKERDFLLLSQAGLFVVTVVYQMQAHSVPCIFLFCGKLT